MARIFTPSEKIRSNTNPQPVSPDAKPANRSRQLVLLKTLFGTPVPALWLLFILSLSSAFSLNILSLSLICCFSFLYICFDLFSSSREFRFHRIGLEIPLLLICIYSAAVYPSLGSDALSYPYHFFFLLIIIYGVSYSLNLFPGLNKYFYILMAFIPLATGFAAWQAMTGMDIFISSNPHLVSSLSFLPYSAAGLSFIPEQFASFLLLVSCFPFAAAACFWRTHKALASFFLVLGLTASIGIFLTQQLSLFILSLFALVFCFGFIKKRYAIVIALILGLTFYAVDNQEHFVGKEFTKLVEQHKFQQETQKNHWRAEFEGFTEQKWLGSGEHISEYLNLQNFQEVESSFFKKNSYLLYLFNNGILFLLFILSFIISLILLNLKLIADIPKTHQWHRIIAIGLMTVQICAYVSSLFYNLWDMRQIYCLFAFLAGVLCYMTESYAHGIIPDDRSL